MNFNFQIASELYKDYLQKQRSEIVEKRKLAKDIGKTIEKENRLVEDAKRHYFEDQIQMYQEKSKEAKEEKLLIQKAHEQELRKMVREQKLMMKHQIEEIKERLKTDADVAFDLIDLDAVKASTFMDLKQK